MTAAESRYQKLRSHLHYLRLEAAAEALPGELERARQEKRSHTASSSGCSRSRSKPPRHEGWPGGFASPACPPPEPWPTSTSTPNPPSTESSSTSSPPSASSRSRPTC